MNLGNRERSGSARLGQSVTELALVLPIMLVLVFGVFELGRVVFIFSSLNNATREAARFGASTGRFEGEQAYVNCPAIRHTVRNAAFLAGLEDGDIQIGYDTPISGTMQAFAQCGEANASEISRGDRIVITVTKNVRPILPILPSDGFSLSFVTARTILKNIVIGPVECSDGEDNDGDTLVDHPNDPGCSAPDDTTEANCYRLAVTSTEGGAVSTQPDPNCVNRYIERTPIRLTAFPDEDLYVFKRWSGDINTRDNPANFAMDSDKNITAEFRRRTSDLLVEKDAPSQVYANEHFTYDIYVTNLFTETAHNVMITDTLPAEVDFQNAYGNGWSCSGPTGGELICELAELASGTASHLSVEVKAPVVNYSPQTITNTVRVQTGYREVDPDDANNSDTATTEVRPKADLAAIEKVGPAAVDADSEFDYTIEVSNLGPSIATGVVIEDLLPTGMSFVSAVGCDSVEDLGSSVLCHINELAVAPTSVTIRVKAPDNSMATSNDVPVTNRATISGAEFDDVGNNTTSTGTTIHSLADLTIDKEAPTKATLDEPFPYDITVTNNGPSAALDVWITDTLPDGVDFLGVNDSLCEEADNVVSCGPYYLPAGAIEQVRIAVRPTRSDQTLVNSATVDSSTEDTYPDDNADSTSTNVVDLTISKSGPTNAVSVGDNFSYVITVDNNGLADATNVEVVDNLPDGVDFVSFDDVTGWTCNSATLTCSPDDNVLSGGEGATITLNVTAADIGTEPVTVNNSATLSANEDRATAEASTTIEPSFDLSLGLTAPQSAEANVPFNYNVAVSNLGPSGATGVTVAITLDSHLTYDGSSNGWTCNSTDNSQEIVCTADNGTLAAGAQTSFTITVTPDSGSGEDYDAISEGIVTAAGSGDYDTNFSNDRASATTTVDVNISTGSDD